MLPLLLAFQDIPTERRVMRKHTNGADYVVLFLDKETGDLVKEDVYYPNGNLQWTGNYKKNIENGTWNFYWENGKIKTVENYLGGKEHGVTTHFDDTGKKIREEFWKHGKKIKELNY
jgi:antitoxin component YwqK of YwqJK toxin-antitoxin module